MRIPICLIFLLIRITLTAQTTTILFLGNSLTYTNDLPSMVSKIGRVYDIEISTDCICLPNYGLEDHVNDGRFQQLLSQNEFDYVVFQQGPSSQAYGRESLIEYGGEIVKASRNHGAEPIYFMVWTSIGYYHTFEDVILNHVNAARHNGARAIPAGAIWKEYHDTIGNSGLYSFDSFHPSPKGSYLAAVIIFHSLFPDKKLEQLLEESNAYWDKESLKQLIKMIVSRDK